VELPSREDEPRPPLVARADGPAHLLVRQDEGLAEAVLREAVVIRRGEEVLRAGETTLSLRPGGRTLAARGGVVVRSPVVDARAREMARVERDDDSRTTTLTGEPILVVRGRGAPGLFDERSLRSRKESPEENVETEVRSGAPLVFEETETVSSVTGGEGVVIVRRTAARETGRLEAKDVELRVTAGQRPQILGFRAGGGVEASGDVEDRGRFAMTAAELAYDGERHHIDLTGDRPTLRLREEGGETSLVGDRLFWNRETGKFHAGGPVRATFPGTVDLLQAAGGPVARDGDAQREALDLRCRTLDGVLTVDEEQDRPSLRSATATGDVVLESGARMATGEALELTIREKRYTAKLRGAPARITRDLDARRQDLVEGPLLLATGGDRAGLRTVEAPRGGRSRLHLEPREEGGSPTRIDVVSRGAVTVGERTFVAEGPIDLEHRTWSRRRETWEEPLKVSGKRLEGSFLPGAEDAERRVERLELVDDVRLDLPDERSLRCARAQVEPETETLRLFGDPDMEFRIPGRRDPYTLRSAYYRYGADLEEGTRFRFRMGRSAPREDR
jgi:lipopolysaccharide export system protein LptA